MAVRLYNEYIKVDPNFIPVFSRNSDRIYPDKWQSFYPHTSFKNILKDVVETLEKSNETKDRSIWMSGAYGTGKTYASFVIKHILEDSIDSSGGSISRAKMFYDISKRTQGLVSRYDYVAFDEIQSIKFTDAMEMQGALKGYLESGEYRVGDSRGVGDAGLILLGNIDSELMDVNQNMFKDLPDIFHESALLDRFHGFIKGWNIPKMKESLKANGWALNTEYFGEIMHYLRDELAYRAVVDQLLQLPKNSATRDTEAIKRICTGYLKLLFPNATDVSKVDVSLFETYCLAPAMEMRRVIKTQLGIIDEGEFGGMTIPEITIKEQYREK